jgi:hypothetical protein
MPCDQGEQGIVAAATDPVTRVEVSAALPDDDLSGVDQLPAESLDAEPLRIGVPAVSGRGRALLVCHVVASALDVGDQDLGVPLTVTLALAIPGLVLELQDADLGTLGLSKHLGSHRCRAERRYI